MQPEQQAKFHTVTCFFSFTSAIFSCGLPLITNVYEYLMAVFRLFQIALAPTRKQNRIGLLFTDKKGDFGPISVTDRAKLRRSDLENGKSLIGWVLCHTLEQCDQVFGAWRK